MIPNPRRRPLVIATAGFVTLWAIVAVAVVPQLIRSGYAGSSISLVNGVFSGRGVHPVEFYLEAWWNVAGMITAILIPAVILFYLGLRFADGRRRAITWTVGGPVGLEVGTLLWYAITLGTLGGLMEASYRAIRQLVTQRPAAEFFWELMWMAPLAAGLAAVVTALALAGFARLAPTRVGAAKATFVFSFLAIHGVVQSEGIPFHPLAEWLLSLGLASMVTRAVRSHPDLPARFARGARPFLAGGFAVLAIFAVLRLPSVAERRALASLPEPDSSLPNVLLIILDTVRAANLSLYGYPRPTTPTLDEWARSGLVFERAYATAPWTLPSHATMFTGRYHYETKTGPNRPLDGTFPTLAEVLRDHGYATAGFVANLGYTSPTSGLDRGFGRYQAHRITAGQVARSSWWSDTLGRPLTALTGALSVSKSGGNVTREFLEWLDQPRERPFFAFLNYFDAHSPYFSPRAFGTRFVPEPEETFGQFSFRWYEAQEAGAPTEKPDLWIGRYDGAISYIDHQMRLVRQALAGKGLLENTLVVVTSDHGEMWGEHGLIEHANSLYVPALHVPLMLSLPGVIEPGRSNHRPVTLRDLPTTVLWLLGVSEVSPFPGSPLDTEWEAEYEPTRASWIMAELDAVLDIDEALAPVGRGDMKSLFRGNLHYILNGDGVEELYDVALDPHELHDLSSLPQFRSTRNALRQALRATGAGGTSESPPGSS